MRQAYDNVRSASDRVGLEPEPDRRGGTEALIQPTARLPTHGDGSVALVPAVQYIGGVGGVGPGLMPCIISWI